MAASVPILKFFILLAFSWTLVWRGNCAPRGRSRRQKATIEARESCVNPEPLQLPRFDITEMSVLGPALPASVTVTFKSKYPLAFLWQKEQTVTLIRSKNFQMMNYFYIPVANDSLHKMYNWREGQNYSTKLTVSTKRDYTLHPFDTYILKIRIKHDCFDVGMKLAIPRSTDGHLVTMDDMAFPRFLQLPQKMYILNPGENFHLNVSMLIEFMDEHTEQSGWYKILGLDEEQQKVEYADSIIQTPRDNFQVVNSIRRPEFSKYIVSSNAAISPLKESDVGLYGYYLVLPEGIHIRVTTELRLQNNSVPNSMVQSCSGATEQDGFAPNFRLPIMRKLDNCIGCTVANMDNPKIGLYKIQDVNGTLEAFEMKMTDRYESGSNFTTAMFPIKKPSGDDDAQYICEAEDHKVNVQRAFGVVTFQPVKLTVVKPNRVDIEKPTKVVFTCKATGEPAPEIIFYKGPRDDADFFNVHRPFDPDKEKGWVRVTRRKHITFHVRYDPKRGTTKARLVFNKANKHDAGGDDFDYKCVARNKYSYNIGFISIYYNGYDI